MKENKMQNICSTFKLEEKNLFLLNVHVGQDFVLGSKFKLATLQT